MLRYVLHLRPSWDVLSYMANQCLVHEFVGLMGRNSGQALQHASYLCVWTSADRRAQAGGV